MPAEYLTRNEINTLTGVMNTFKDGPLSDVQARLQCIIDRHSEPSPCGALFPWSGIRIRCTDPLQGHVGSHSWAPVPGPARVWWGG